MRLRAEVGRGLECRYGVASVIPREQGDAEVMRLAVGLTGSLDGARSIVCCIASRISLREA